MNGFSISHTIKGVEDIPRKFAELQRSLLTVQIKAMQDAVFLIHQTAVNSIQAQQSEGREYKRKSVTHVASQPGYPPNTDTGRLVQSIQFEFDNDGLTGLVGTNLEYGAFLEFGTTKMAARPWLAPAVEQTAKEIGEIFSNALSEGIKDVVL